MTVSIGWIAQALALVVWALAAFGVSVLARIGGEGTGSEMQALLIGLVLWLGGPFIEARLGGKPKT